ncbi:lipoprotein-releasing ABC transporter permease subunit [Gilvimarinus sp. F26214L]|uniref:lipoprotein-releasing ABC transporter permease subunit n=1 Tax=Gilvimarinus sp. DZF01 TaxID=3461371 RepID=UPI004046720D
MLSFFIGLRYTASRRHSQLVSFISSISIAGLVISVALLVVVLSVMNGFDKELRERILAILPQAAIQHMEGVENWSEVRDWVAGQDGVEAAAPFVQVAGMAEYRREIAPLIVNGLDPQLEKDVSAIEDFLPPELLTVLQDPANNGAIILGSGLADKLKVSRGDRLKIIVPQGSGGELNPRVAGVRVAGIINTGTEVDQSMALSNLATAQDLAGLGSAVTGIKLKVEDLFRVESIVYPIVRSLPYGYTSTTWVRSKGNLYQAIQMSKNLVGLLLFLIIGIAAFNLVSTLVMVTVDKQSDIAILRTLGASTQRIMAVFMVQGSVIGLVGTGLGLVLGLLLAFAVQDLVQWVEALFNFQFLQSDVYPISFVPSEVRPMDLLSISGVALFLSFFATLYPAWRASRVKPAEALRFEV